MASGSGFSTGGPGAEFFALNNPQNQNFRSQVSGIFLDPNSQIAQRAAMGFSGKRTLSEFQTQNQNMNQFQYQNQNQSQFQYQSQSQSQNQMMYQNQVVNGLNLRSVKQRLYNHSSPISPLEFSGVNFSPERYGSSLIQQTQPGQTGNFHPTGGVISGFPCLNPVQSPVLASQESEKLKNQLQELEKQLLDDDDVSVLTTKTDSEWSETIQAFFSPSPTTSSSSTSTSESPKQSLIAAATAISEGQNDAASEILTRLSQPGQPDSEQRILGIMVPALKSRLGGAEATHPAALYGPEHVAATHSLFDASPCFKLGFMAANQAIIDATIGSSTIHVVDFGIGQGFQYVNLLHALSGRSIGKVRITAVNSGENLTGVRDRLAEAAGRVGIGLEFKAFTTQKPEDLTRDAIGSPEGEPIAVNFAFTLYKTPDESVTTDNPRDALLRRVKSLAPRVVTLVEQEMNTNTAPFVARVTETASYYGALLESLDAVLGGSPGRVSVEAGLGHRVLNSVACEGLNRVERCEVFGKWRSRFCMAGFDPKPLDPRVAELMRNRLSSGNRVNPGFTVEERNGAVLFGWKGRALTVASAWR